MLVLSASLLAIAAVATTVVATNSNDKTSLLMRNVEALAYDEGGIIERARVRNDRTETMIAEHWDGSYYISCKVDVTTTTYCLGEGDIPCVWGRVTKGSPYDCKTSGMSYYTR